jgi:Family of unknown function (DUF6084)
MTDLGFTVLGARAEPYAAAPTLVFRLRLTESTGERIHAIALRCQIQIEPRQRHYTGSEEERLLELFGEPRRWGETLKTVLWTHASIMVPGFTGSLEIDLPVACTYDFEVTAAKYFHALDGGEIPLLLLFNGTVFTRGQTGFSVEPVPWEKEAAYRLPVRVWRELMDQYFPGGAWIRLRRESFDALHLFKARRALPTWDDAVESLLREAEGEPS